ncbi:hypothetical protein FKZ61_003850 [Litorilinea aerophila]|uniref:Uncharacterized protein n=1 Tax=Litorilinea aerophila TaxID=1204385 RepID=A0A540VKC1_9CHLR|nr:hypothetical protein [Litorilinea aerophila]MCC9075247.1 hypothetical protein [Litorilinea aerophila]OUC07753.1 hypothetical protein RY27_13030 [Litorilinea aerophila]
MAIYRSGLSGFGMEITVVGHGGAAAWSPLSQETHASLRQHHGSHSAALPLAHRRISAGIFWGWGRRETLFANRFANRESAGRQRQTFGKMI